MVMKRYFIAVLFSLFLFSCSKHNYHTVTVSKPRIHNGWYKHHVWHKSIKAGRIHLRLFEKQGTKKVKMKG